MNSHDAELRRRERMEQDEDRAIRCRDCGMPLGDPGDYVDADGICRIPEPLLCPECEEGDYDEDEEVAA